MQFKKKVKEHKILVSIVMVLLSLLVIGIVFMSYFKSVVNAPLQAKGNSVKIVVNEGEGITQVINDMAKKGYMRNKYISKIKIKMSYKYVKLIPGSYNVGKNASLGEIIKILQTEDTGKNTVKITIPEGYTIDAMATLFQQKGLFSSQDFINAVKNYPLPAYVHNNSKKKYNLEGFLYPNTYYFNKKSTPTEVIEVLLNEFDVVMKEVQTETGVTVNTNDMETVINKASLIEKEVRVPQEKSIVSSVIQNRLNKKMKLQFCSTVNYVIGYAGHDILTYKDIEVDSPYNTYKYEGLPVGPIASPCKESIIAALKPANTEYLYFVLSQDGKTHIFSKTEEEHNAAKARVQASNK